MGEFKAVYSILTLLLFGASMFHKHILFLHGRAEVEPRTREGSDAEGFPYTEGDGYIRTWEGDGNTRQIYLFIYLQTVELKMNLEHEKVQMLKDFHIQKEMVISEHEKEMEIHVKFIYL